MSQPPTLEEQKPAGLLQTPRVQAALVIGGLVMASIILAPLLSGTLREALIVPLLYVMWTLWLFVSRLPQAVFWAIFLAAGLILAIRSLRSGPLFLPGEEDPVVRSPGRVTILARWINELNQGVYFRRRMGQHILQLTLEANGYHERPSADHLAEMLADNTLKLPTEVTDYVQASAQLASLQSSESMSAQRGGLAGWVHELLGKRSPAAKNTQALEILVAYLEDELEIPHDIVHR